MEKCGNRSLNGEWPWRLIRGQAEKRETDGANKLADIGALDLKQRGFFHATLGGLFTSIFTSTFDTLQGDLILIHVIILS